MIKIEIDRLGQITSQIDQVRQGDKGVVVQATFEDKDNINYVAKINLTRADGEIASGITMLPDAEHSDTFVKTLETEWYFCKHGQTSLTVYLYKSGVVDAQGQVNFNVEKTDYDGEPTITPDQYDELVELIATKLNIVNGIVVANTISALGNLLDYNVGQVFYVRNDGKIYQLNSSYNLDTVIDFYLVDFTILNEVEVSETKTANKITKSIALKNTHGQTFYDFDIEFDVATTSNAGLMSASDKNKLDNLPTGSAIAQTYETKVNAQASHQDLQVQIDAIISKSDVVDVVGTYAELEDYDTSKLGDNDIIKVLVDETKNNQRSYYRWLKDDEEFEYVGSEGEFYTKSESDQLFLKKVDAEETYQHKVKVMNTIPTTDDLEENEIAVVPSIEDLGDTIIGDGLELTTDAQTGAKILKSTRTQLYKHTIIMNEPAEPEKPVSTLILINTKNNQYSSMPTLDDLSNSISLKGYLVGRMNNFVALFLYDYDLCWITTNSVEHQNTSPYSFVSDTVEKL